MSILRLDHLALSCQTLPDGVAHVERRLGADMSPGGKHDAMGTYNRLLGLGDRLYLEAIAVDPDAPAPMRPRWFNLDAFTGPPRLTNWVLQTDDLDRALDLLGPEFGVPMALQRADLSWRMAVPDSGILPWGGWGPALIEWVGDAHPAPRLPDHGLRLTSLRIAHPQAGDMADRLCPLMPRDTALFEPSDTPEITASFQTPAGTAILR